MSTTNILDLNNRIDELEKNSGGGGSADSAKRSDIATEFSTETSYTAGNFVYYEGKLYQFNADHSAGAWDPTDVVEANVTDQIVSNSSAIAGLTASDVAYGTTSVKNALDELSKPAVGEVVDISTYNTAINYYECPSDGYIRILGTDTNVANAYLLQTGTALNYVVVQSKELYSSVFVRKGARVYVIDVNKAIFMPLVNYT